MTYTLTTEKIAEIERIVLEQAAGTTPYSDETDCLVWAALPALIGMAKRSIELEAIKNSLLKDWSQNSLHGRLQLLGRAEKAEADAVEIETELEKLRLAERDGCTCRFHDYSGRQTVECPYHREIRASAERGEAEAARYREMAVRLAGAMHSLVYEENSDEYLIVREARAFLEQPDIAALFAGSGHD